MNTHQSARELQEQVEIGEKAPNSDDTSLVLNTVLNTINNKFEHNSPDKAVGLLNTYLIHQSTDNCVP
jgi:hypothetical protein